MLAGFYPKWRQTDGSPALRVSRGLLKIQHPGLGAPPPLLPSHLGLRRPQPQPHASPWYLSLSPAILAGSVTSLGPQQHILQLRCALEVKVCFAPWRTSSCLNSEFQLSGRWRHGPGAALGVPVCPPTQDQTRGSSFLCLLPREWGGGGGRPGPGGKRPRRRRPPQPQISQFLCRGEGGGESGRPWELVTEAWAPRLRADTLPGPRAGMGKLCCGPASQRT